MLHYTNICYILSENCVIRLPKLEIPGFSRPPLIATASNFNRNPNQNPNRIAIKFLIESQSQFQSEFPNESQSNRNQIPIAKESFTDSSPTNGIRSDRIFLGIESSNLPNPESPNTTGYLIQDVGVLLDRQNDGLKYNGVWDEL